jgi:hypothetical protein
MPPDTTAIARIAAIRYCVSFFVPIDRTVRAVDTVVKN